VSQTSGTTDTLLAVDFVDAENATAVGQLGTIIKTADGGVTWTRQESGTNQDLYDVIFSEAATGTAVGGFGTILRTVAGSESSTCPQTVGYWKHRPALWPVDSLELGSESYSKEELRGILTTVDWKSDASLILAGELIAAKLNLANGSDPAPITGAIADADGRLSGFSGKLPYNVSRKSETGSAMLNDAGTLRLYNAGELTPDCTP
jgi:hypothetical protein